MPVETEAPKVESQPTPEVVHPESMNDSQRERWLRTGEHPEIQPKPAESAPAKSEAAASQPAEKQQGKGKNGEDRKAQLAAEIKQLLEERAAIRQELETAKKPAEPQAAKPEVSQPNAPKPPERPKRPDITQFKTTAEYDVAMDKYDADVETYSAQKAAFDKATADAKEAQTKLETKLKDGWDRIVQKYPDATDVSVPLFKALMDNAKAMPEVTWFLNNTEILPDMLYALGGKFKLDEFIQEGKTNPAKAIRVLVMMESEIIAELEKSAKTPEPEKEVAAPRETKKVTEAPPPPKEVGGKASATEDPVKSGVANSSRASDGTRYLSDSFTLNANKRDIARRTRGR